LSLQSKLGLFKTLRQKYLLVYKETHNKSTSRKYSDSLRSYIKKYFAPYLENI
jgi:hypothetical protein